MTLNDVLFELLAKLLAENMPILLSWDTIQQWPEDSLEVFIQLGLLTSASATQSIECSACEQACYMDIITRPDDDPALSRAFIICDHLDKQSQVGRVQVPLIRLQQWQSSHKQLAKLLADLLGFKDKIKFTGNQTTIRLVSGLVTLAILVTPLLMNLR